ncbi:vacuolar protein sorting vps41, putative, partial [Perkinsus marinus ATCC 50983]
MSFSKAEAVISDSSSSSDSEASSEEDEEEVPIVDYHLVEADDVCRVVSTEEVTAVKITKDKLLVGTCKGSIYAFDGRGKLVGMWTSHTAAVTCIDTDYTERYVASSSEDASVCVVSLKINSGRIIAHTDLSINSHRSVVFGGEDYKLVLTKRGTLFNNNSILHSGEGTITRIKWMNSMIAWTNLKGMK